MIVVAILGATLSWSGCREFALTADEEPDTRIAGDITAELGVPFELVIGQSARLDPYGFVVRFEAVQQDTRCPRNADCITAGQVGAVFQVLRDDGSSTAFQLWVPGLIDSWFTRGDVFQSGQERFRLLWVDPYPEANVSIGDDDWRAVIRVDHGI